MDQNGKIDMEEFLSLSRNLEPVRLQLDEATRLFNKLSDKERVGEDETKRVISFQNFAIGCVENDLFTLQAQLAFLKVIDKKECILQLNAVHPKDDRTRLVEERLRSVSKYTDYYASWVEPIKKALVGDYSKNANVILIKLKLIEAESVRVCTE